MICKYHHKTGQLEYDNTYVFTRNWFWTENTVFIFLVLFLHKSLLRDKKRIRTHVFKRGNYSNWIQSSCFGNIEICQTLSREVIKPNFFSVINAFHYLHNWTLILILLTFQPVTLYVFPALPIVIVLSHIPGSVAVYKIKSIWYRCACILHVVRKTVLPLAQSYMLIYHCKQWEYSKITAIVTNEKEYMGQCFLA